MTRLALFYDARCGLCCAARAWVDRQPQLLPIECHPKPEALDDLVVLADSGEMWSGDSAWLMILWALDGYRHWAYRFASPVLWPTARALFARLSEYRGPLSCRLGLRPEVE